MPPDDERKPIELGILEREIKRVKNGRLLPDPGIRADPGGAWHLGEPSVEAAAPAMCRAPRRPVSSGARPRSAGASRRRLTRRKRSLMASRARAEGPEHDRIMRRPAHQSDSRW